jgi:plasmid stabilization system protein ParE
MKKLRKHPQAERDIACAVEWYAEMSLEVSNRFLEEVESALERVRRLPSSGSPGFSHRLDLPDLRTISLHNFPYLLIYFEREKYIDLVRVLHSHRDTFNILLDVE